MIKDKHKKYYQSLTRNMILTVIIVSFTPMILVISILLHQFDKSYQEKTYAHLSELVQKHEQNIDSFLNEKIAKPPVEDLVTDVYDEVPQHLKKQLDELKQHIKKYPESYPFTAGRIK